MNRLNKYFLRKTLKVPYIFIIIIVIILLLFITSFISYTKVIIKSIVIFFGRIPLYYKLSSPEVNTI
jgi:hypothetical protein